VSGRRRRGSRSPSSGKAGGITAVRLQIRAGSAASLSQAGVPPGWGRPGGSERWHEAGDSGWRGRQQPLAVTWGHRGSGAFRGARWRFSGARSFLRCGKPRLWGRN